MNKYNLVSNILSGGISKEPMKNGFGRGLVLVGEKDNQVVALSADVAGSTSSAGFAEKFPERFVQVGIAEQNLVTVASGMAASGKIPYIAAYAAFSPGRNWEQIRTTVCINDMPVKIISTHVGLSDAPDAATHQMLEDLALMRSLPNMTVIAPVDSLEAAKATLAVAGTGKPAYIRIARDDTAIITSKKTPFEIGKAYVYREGVAATIIATGRMTYHALIAADMLAKYGIDVEVIHSPTVKPLDTETILTSVKKTNCVITAEEAQAVGGLGGAVAELLGEVYPVPIKRVGIQDRFGESARNPADLFKALGLTPDHIVFAAHEIIESKKRG